ncbi:MAG TPA: bifunctional riboflavin kinase/FAD synthetase [Gammaproteobacteria bacterium]|nr:bifunctional riboflavin kinase/FAD synthetase [Gammaproteobacteria bacterium]
MLKLIRGIYNLPETFPRCVLTIGNFDGVHIGHQQLLKQLQQKAREMGLPTLVITFEPQPNEFFKPQDAPPRLMRLHEKIRVLNTLGVDYVLCLRFDPLLARLSAEDFVHTLLIDKLNAAYVLVGDDFHFGYKRGGDIRLLKQMGERLGFLAEQMPTYVFKGERVSSSRVRQALEQGRLDVAQQLLNRHYGISGKVAHGDKRGRMLGFPTANVFLHRKAVSLSGIYAVITHGVLPHPVKGVAYVGNRPTIDGGGRSLLEVHLFDFNQEIYGRHIYVEFLHKLRDDKKFDSVELMQQQILIDAKQAREYFG